MPKPRTTTTGTRRRGRSPSPTSDNEIVLDDEAPRRKKKKEKKKKETEQYKSAQFIEDSDEEYGDIEAFLEKEKAMREKAARAAEAGGGRIGTMKPTGTKKRRRKAGDDKASAKKRKKGDSPSMPIDNKILHKISSQLEGSDSDIVVSTPVEHSPSAPRPRPKPRPITKHVAPSHSSLASPPRSQSPIGIEGPADKASSASEADVESVVVTSRRRNRLVILDDD